jgi:hypothetical protein
MKLDIPLKILGPVDHRPLKQAALDLAAEAWLEGQGRQTHYEVHRQTESVVLVWCDEEPGIPTHKGGGWPYLADTAVPLMEDIQSRFYERGGRVFRAMVAKLAPEGKIDPHVDQGESFATSHRIHVPLQTNPGVQFKINGRSFHLEEGIAYEVSNLDPHAVANRGLRDRLHFIFDYAVQ